jgi:hypothetical protein
MHGCFIRLDDYSFGLEGTCIHTSTAARTFSPVYPAYRSIYVIGCQGTFWTGIHAGRGRALPALENAQVMGKLFKRILAYLDAGQRQVFSAFMDQRASQHTTQAALAFLGIYHQVAFSRRNLCFSLGAGHDITPAPQREDHQASAFKEFSPGKLRIHITSNKKA